MTMKVPVLSAIGVVLTVLPGTVFGADEAATVPGAVNARLLRFPHVSKTQIAFVYAGDIWVVPKQGGVAVRLSSPPGEESFPRFSPDGSRIAYTANYDGADSVYVIPALGGDRARDQQTPGGGAVAHG